PGGGAQRAEHTIQVHIEAGAPALVRVVLEGALRHAGALVAYPVADEPRAGVDAGVGEDHVKPAMRFHRLIERAVDGDRIAHIDAGPAHYVARLAQALRLIRETLLVD